MPPQALIGMALVAILTIAFVWIACFAIKAGLPSELKGD